MSQSAITIQNDTDLHHRIMKLNSLKEEQEIAIKHSIRELVYEMSPQMMVKNLLKKISGNEETRHDLRSIGINLGKDFLISRLFGRNGSLKGFISSLLVKKATDYVVSRHSDQIANGVHKVEEYVKEGLHKVQGYMKSLTSGVSN